MDDGLWLRARLGWHPSSVHLVSNWGCNPGLEEKNKLKKTEENGLCNCTELRSGLEGTEETDVEEYFEYGWKNL